MGRFVWIPAGFSLFLALIRRKSSEIFDFLTFFCFLSKKCAPWNILLSFALATPGCAVTGAMVRVRCAHNDLVVAHCVVWPHLSRAKP